jgi:hypothetical protein
VASSFFAVSALGYLAAGIRAERVAAAEAEVSNAGLNCQAWVFFVGREAAGADAARQGYFLQCNRSEQQCIISLTAFVVAGDRGCPVGLRLAAAATRPIAALDPRYH